MASQLPAWMLFSTRSLCPTATVKVEKDSVQSHPDTVGKDSEIISGLSPVAAAALATQEHPATVGKDSEIYSGLPPVAAAALATQEHPATVGKDSEIYSGLPPVAAAALATQEHPATVGKDSEIYSGLPPVAAAALATQEQFPGDDAEPKRSSSASLAQLLSRKDTRQSSGLQSHSPRATPVISPETADSVQEGHKAAEDMHGAEGENKDEAVVTDFAEESFPSHAPDGCARTVPADSRPAFDATGVGHPEDPSSHAGDVVKETKETEALATDSHMHEEHEPKIASLEHAGLEDEEGKLREMERQARETAAQAKKERERRERVRAFLAAEGYRHVRAARKKWSPIATYPLHRAVQCNDPEVVRLLLWMGANPASSNAFGQTPARLAKWLNRRDSHAEIIEALKAHSGDSS